MNIIKSIIVAEIILVNLLAIVKCANRKYKSFPTYSILFAFTIVVFAVSYLFFIDNPFFDNGNGIFNILGFVFLIPCYFLAKESLARMVVIFCMAWVFSLGGYIVAVQIAKMFPANNFIMNVLISQTVIFAVFTYPVQRMVVPRYSYILNHISNDKKMERLVYAIGVFHFITLLAFSHELSFERGTIGKIILIVLLECGMLICYLVLYNMVYNGEQIRKLNETMRKDELTGVFNRMCLFDDLQKKLTSTEMFNVCFIDLDSFKSINDGYGHLVGDWYLKTFTECTLSVVEKEGKLYRFGGDEFVVVYDGKNVDSIIEKIHLSQNWPKDALCPFKGASVGKTLCKPPHMTVEEVLSFVDKSMYEKKLATYNK